MSQRAAAAVATPAAVAVATPTTGTLRRRCACGNHTIGGAECDTCARAKDTLFRKAAAPTGDGPLPGIVRSTLQRPGVPLSPGVRADFESRFGGDLSTVRVHADDSAAASAGAIGAHAYTLGSHIVFGHRQYAPHTSQGRELLAHELVHTLQQKAALPSDLDTVRIGHPNDAAEHEADRLAADALAERAAVPKDTAPPRLMRKVSKDFDRIKSDLTYGVLDWAITDKEARDVLAILKGLENNDQDLRDTVAAMQKEGILNRLFEELPKEDIKKEQALLEKIARMRSWSEKGPGGTMQTRHGSCSPEQLKTIEATHVQAAGWLDQVLAKLAAFKAAPKDAAQKAVADIFNKYFFSLEPRVIDYVVGVLQGIRADFGRWSLFKLDCFDWSPSCHDSGAYASYGSPPSINFCSSYFSTDQIYATRTLIHEVAHTQPNVTRITDRAYRSDRLIGRLSPVEALTNADSYALLVWHLVQGKSGIYAPVDEHPDCPDGWKSLLKEVAARAQRSNRNAQVTFAAMTPTSLPTTLDAHEQAWLGGKDNKAIRNALNVFDQASSTFADSITFECEPGGGGRCDTSTFYWYFSGNLHVCPSWPTLPEPEREVRLLAGVYGYTGAGSNTDERLRLARLANSISGRGWAVPTDTDVLGGPSTWKADYISIEVTPVQPTVPNRAYYTEDGTSHQRMSQELAVYQNRQCGQGPADFKQRIGFRVDVYNYPRPRPFLAPQLLAEFKLNTAGQSPSWRYEDQRPVYLGAGQPLQHQIPDPISLSLPDDGTLHSRITMDDPSTGVHRVYEDNLPIKAKVPCPQGATGAAYQPTTL